MRHYRDETEMMAITLPQCVCRGVGSERGRKVVVAGGGGACSVKVLFFQSCSSGPPLSLFLFLSSPSTSKSILSNQYKLIHLIEWIGGRIIMKDWIEIEINVNNNVNVSIFHSISTVRHFMFQSKAKRRVCVCACCACCLLQMVQRYAMAKKDEHAMHMACHGHPSPTHRSRTVIL